MRFALVLLTLLVVAQADALTRAEIQNALDKDGYCFVPPGTHDIDGKIVVRAGDMLCGGGFASVLRLTRGTVAIEMGESPYSAAPYLYGASVQWLRVAGGTVRVSKIAQHNELIGVWVSGAAGDGFLLDGVGEQMELLFCNAWDNGGAGFAIRSIVDNNGILLQKCNAQNNYGPGVVVETRHVNAGSTHHSLRDCVIQANGRDNEFDFNRDGRIDASDLAALLGSGQVAQVALVTARMGATTTPADVVISGWVNNLELSSWVEATIAPLALLVEPRTWGDTTRYVGGLWIGGNANVHREGGGPAVMLKRPHLATIDALTLTPPTSRLLVETADTRNVAGAMRRLQAGQLVESLPGSVSR